MYNQLIEDLKFLTTPDIIGNYSCFDVYEISAIDKNNAYNIYTLLIAKEFNEDDNHPKSRITPKPIEIKNCAYKFEIQKYKASLNDLEYELKKAFDCEKKEKLNNNFKQTSKNLKEAERLIQQAERQDTYPQWNLSRDPMYIGKLVYEQKKLIHAESNKHTDSAVLQVFPPEIRKDSNRCLYLLELHDIQKQHIRKILCKDEIIDELSKQIKDYWDISLENVTDRLGNILIIFPIHSISFDKIRNDAVDKEKGITRPILSGKWKESVPSRSLFCSVINTYDNAVESYSGIRETKKEFTIIFDAPNRNGGYIVTVYDETHNILLHQSAELYPIRSIVTEISVESTFGSSTQLNTITIGRPVIPYSSNWLQQRLYKEGRLTREQNKTFLQYVPSNKIEKKFRHQKAIQDFCEIINTYRRKGDNSSFYVWDPYLTIEDIIEIYDHLQYKQISCFAITSSLPSKKDCNYYKIKEKIDTLSKNKINLFIKTKKGAFGYPFHDRFLIVPQIDRPTLAWSLGTSINSLGYTHHIIQKVEDGPLIEGAFMDIWEALPDTDCCVYKKDNMSGL